MFEPYDIGSLDRSSILWWEQIIAGIARSPLRAIVRLGETHHAVILKENARGKMDQVMADRLKQMCGLKQMHAVAVSIPMKVRNGIEQKTEILPYFMFAAAVSFDVETRSLKFETHRTLKEVSLEETSDRFKIEVIKIVLFRFLIGTSNSSLDHIIVMAADGMPKSISETYIGDCKQESKFVDACVGRWASEQTRSLVEQARKELCSSFDLDMMRGVLLGLEGPKRDLRRQRTKKDTTVPVRRIAELVEERLDIVRSAPYETLRDHLIR